MLDTTDLSVKLPAPALEGPQHGISTSTSAGSSHLCSPSTVTCHCAICCTLFPRSEPSQNQSSLKLPRPLPTPPPFASPLPTLSTPMPSLSTSSVTSTAPRLLSSCSHPPRPLPKMPRSAPSSLGATGRVTYMNGRSLPPVSPADIAGSLSAPQQPANAKIRREKSSELQCHPGKFATTDLVSPPLDTGELSDSSRTPLAPITPENLSQLTDEVPEKLVRQYSYKWLREKRGRRWVEDDYRMIVQRLRKLR